MQNYLGIKYFSHFMSTKFAYFQKYFNKLKFITSIFSNMYLNSWDILRRMIIGIINADINAKFIYESNDSISLPLYNVRL